MGKKSKNGDVDSRSLIDTSGFLRQTIGGPLQNLRQMDSFLEALWPTRTFTCDTGEREGGYSHIIRCVTLPSPRLPRRLGRPLSTAYDKIGRAHV